MDYNIFNTLKYTVLMINTVCTLKCKDCVTSTPFQQQKRNHPLNELQNDINRYFEIMHGVHLEHFDFIGGEPLLHPKLPELVRWVIANHGEKFDEFRILTNGTIQFSDELINALLTGKSQILIDHYGGLSKCADEIADKLDKNAIKYRLTRYDGHDEQSNDWIDFGDFSYRNYTQEQLLKLECDCCELIARGDVIMRHHLHINNGILGICDRQISAPLSVPLPEGDYVNLRIDEPIDEILDKMKSFKLKTIACCQYCNGFVLDKKKRIGVPVAMQL